jgi:hypothetical protein
LLGHCCSVRWMQLKVNILDQFTAIINQIAPSF